MKTLRIDDFCRTGSGGTPNRKKASLYYGGDIDWFKSGELNEAIVHDAEEKISKRALEESSAKLIPKGAVLLAMYGATVGKTAILGKEATTNQAVCHLVPDPKLCKPEFLQRFLQSKINQLLDARVGGAQPNISQGIVRSLEVPLPSLEEQDKIIAKLAIVDLCRKNRNQTITELDTYLRSLFFEMFGDPVTNPKKWPKKSLKDCVEEFRYGTSVKAEGGKHPVLRIPNITGDEIDLTDLKRVTLKDAEAERILLRKGDILFVRTNGNQEYIGRSNVFDLQGEYVYASYLIRARLKMGLMNPKFLTVMLNSSTMRNVVMSKTSTTAGQYNINTENLGAIEVVIPPIEKQHHFVEMTDKIRQIKKQMNQSKFELSTLFNSKLAEAFLEAT